MKLVRCGIILAACFIAGCSGESDTTKLADAQACINQSKPESAGECLNYLKGVSGKRAALMRCSIKFIEEGYGEVEKIMNVMDELGSDSGSSNPSLSAMSLLAFRAGADEDENLKNATLAKKYCLESASDGYIKLGSFAHIATSFMAVASDANVTISPDEPPTEEDLVDIIDYLANAPEGDPAAEPIATGIGETVIDSYKSSCTGGQTDTFCTDLKSALDQVGPNPTPEQVGRALLEHLRNS